MSNPKVKPLLFRVLDEEHASGPAWMSVEAANVEPVPFMKIDGSTLVEGILKPANDSALPLAPSEPEVEPVPEEPQPSHRSSVFPSAPQEHAAIAEGGIRPTVLALPPSSGPIRPAAEVVAEPVVSPAVLAEKRAFSEALLDIATLRARALREAEQGLTDLAVRVAQAILERELEGDPRLHLELVRHTLAALGDVHRSKLRASPRTYDAIVEVQGSAVVEYDGVSVSIIRDPSMDGLGCIVEGDVNLVDGRVEERLAAVWRGFRSENQRRAAEEVP